MLVVLCAFVFVDLLWTLIERTSLYSSLDFILFCLSKQMVDYAK